MQPSLDIILLAARERFQRDNDARSREDHVQPWCHKLIIYAKEFGLVEANIGFITPIIVVDQSQSIVCPLEVSGHRYILISKEMMEPHYHKASITDSPQMS